jgi:hypothetical protein
MEIVVRLLDATELTEMERMLASMADERLVAVLLASDRKRAHACVHRASARGSIRLIRALVAHSPADELADWLMAAPPAMAAGAVVERYESHATVVGRLLQNLDVTHAGAILEIQRELEI